MRKRWCALGAACLVLFDLGAGNAAPHPVSSPRPHPPRPSALYGPGIRRSAQTYLRLKLLELREADLDRARLVIEHKLGIDALLETSPPRPADAAKRNKP